jgi:hypothetical protein
LEEKFRASVVWLILNGKTEKALELLAEHHDVEVPNIKVGLPKAHKKNTLGCYSSKDGTISVFNSDAMKEPFIILHEFYHHLRTSVDLKHKGTEKNANEFAKGYIQAYRSMTIRTSRNSQETPC